MVATFVCLEWQSAHPTESSSGKYLLCLHLGVEESSIYPESRQTTPHLPLRVDQSRHKRLGNAWWTSWLRKRIEI